MGKMTSIYLTDEEASDLESYCEENQCSQYSVLKTALRDFLSNAKAESLEKDVEQEEDSEELSEQEEEQQNRKEEIAEFIKRLLNAGN